MAKGMKPVYAVISATENEADGGKTVTYQIRTVYDGIRDITLPAGDNFTVLMVKNQMSEYNDSRQTHRTVAKVIKEYLKNVRK